MFLSVDNTSSVASPRKPVNLNRIGESRQRRSWAIPLPLGNASASAFVAPDIDFSDGAERLIRWTRT
jgi:hypothetical protein